jgi:hypothetical protein
MVMIADVGHIAEAIPEYDVEREVGRGGMGVVFLGRHRRLGRGVAIKELPPTFASDPGVRDRFAAEARTLASVSHPHIVPIFDYVERDGLCLIVMEELPGGTLWDRFTTTGLTPPAACAVVMACCAALHHAHAKGVLHLDVKPDNLMFDAEATVKVTDFGIAQVISGGRTLGTVDGQILGTPAYMSPEQARGNDLTPASDVYSVGVMLYELLSGHLPWSGAETAAELLSQRLREDPTPVREVAPHVKDPLATVVMRAVAREREERYSTAEELGVAIGEACASSWGPEWLDHAGVALVGSDRMSRAARTTAQRGAPAPAPGVTGPAKPGRAAATGAVAPTDPIGTRAAETGVVGRAPGAGPRSAETGVARRAPAPADRARETVAPDQPPGHAPASGAPPAPPEEPTAPPIAPAPGAAPEFRVVRAASADSRIQGADLYLLEQADLVDVEDVLDPPERPVRAMVITAALALAALAVAVIGIGGHTRGGDLTEGQVELAGQDVASGDRIAVDLSGDLPVRTPDPALAASADRVEVELSYLGRGVATFSGPVRDGAGTIDPGIARRTVGGNATATVRVLDDGQVIAEHDVGIDATQSWYLTLPLIGGALVLLLAYANLEGSLKPLRSGHRRRLSWVGAAISCAIASVGVVAVVAALGLQEPTIPGLVVTVVLGAGAGVAAATARVGLGRRRRIRRAVKRAEKTLGTRTGQRRQPSHTD